MPENEPLSWNRVNASTLSCPRKLGFTVQPSTDRLNWNCLVPTPQRLTRPGFLCHKTKWTTTCYKSFFGSNTISHAVHHKRVAEHECRQAVKDFLKGWMATPAFPAPNCGWLNTNTEEHIFVIVSHHPVTVDPYNRRFLDQQFIGGSCRFSFCDTIYDSVSWVSSHEVEPHCPTEEKTLSVYPSEVTGKFDAGSVVWSPSFIRTTFDHACQTQICKGEAVLFNHGAVCIHNNPPSGQSASVEAFKDLISNLPRCSDDVEMVFQDADLDRELALLSEVDSLSVLECIDAVNLARSTRQVNQMTLNHMMPDHACVGPAFRLHNGYLEVSTVKYIPVNIDPSNLDGHHLGLRENGQPYVWDVWVPSGVDGVESGVNGLSRSNGKVHLPWMTIKYQMMEALFDEMQETNLVRHPIVDIVSRTQNVSDEQLDQHYRGGNVIEKVEHLFGTAAITTMVWTLVGSGLCILLILCICSHCRMIRVSQGDPNTGVSQFNPHGQQNDGRSTSSSDYWGKLTSNWR